VDASARPSKGAAKHVIINFVNAFPGSLILVSLEPRITGAVEHMTAPDCADENIHVSETFLCLSMIHLSRLEI
jgi:hypothetical protein